MIQPKRSAIVLFLLLGFLLSSCRPGPRTTATRTAPSATVPMATAGVYDKLPELKKAWKTQDVRLLDAPDGAQAGDDLIAVYTRRSASELQVRLDFLDLRADTAHDVYIALSTGDNSRDASDLPIDARSDFTWNTLLVVPSSGNGYAQTPDGQRLTEVSISTQTDPDLDAAYVNITGLKAATIQLAQVFVTPPGSQQASDQSAAVRLDSSSPQPAHLLMAFWNTLPAHTPAQALRRWDGAHTGPLGQRHGLYRLLAASSAAGVPVALLDLKTTSSLSALDFLGQVDTLRDLQARGLAILPDAAFGDPQAAGLALDLSRNASAEFFRARQPASLWRFLPRPAAGKHPDHVCRSDGRLAHHVRGRPAAHPTAAGIPFWSDAAPGLVGRTGWHEGPRVGCAPDTGGGCVIARSHATGDTRRQFTRQRLGGFIGCTTSFRLPGRSPLDLSAG